MINQHVSRRPASVSRESRRRFLKQLAMGLASGCVLAACAPLLNASVPEEVGVKMPTGAPEDVPAREDSSGWQPPEPRTGDLPAGAGAIDVWGVGTLLFDTSGITSVRPDIFRSGHFSLFDALMQLDRQGDVTLDYHFDETMDTHVIDALNGKSDWWYRAHYAAGWPEPNAFRMDMYPYKNRMWIQLIQGEEEWRARVHRTFRQEVARWNREGQRAIIPDFTIRTPIETWTFKDVEATAHNARSDVLQPGVATALDALISLTERGDLPGLGLTWYESIGAADPVDSYWVEELGASVASGGCGFVYETGPRGFVGFSGSHIHIPADVRVIRSPEYALWFWICL
ncbi:MAG: hypothetical protein JXB35_16645 [Anaerolineae bacterium]|nr:hypothetical protein [Anaerolineae bacterium]